MRLHRLTPCLLLCLALPGPAGAQDANPMRKRVLHQLASRQQRAAKSLEDLLGKIELLVKDLEERGEVEKAELLKRAVAIVTGKNLTVAKVRDASGQVQQILGNLEQAMNKMARILQERPDATDEVQDLGKEVVGALGEIIHVLTGEDEIKSLEQREKTLRDIRQEADQLAKRQAELRRDTQNTVPRTQAEQAAARAQQELMRLARQVRDLDRQARSELDELDRAREFASRLQDLLQRQQRLRNETAVRAGRTDKLTPRVNRLLAEMQAMARAARRAEEEEARRSELAEAAEQVSALAERQQQIAKEINARAALERALDAVRRGERDDKLKKALEEAAKAAPEEADARALRDAIRELNLPQARDKAAQVLQAALKEMASSETLARDERAVARDIERTLMRAPEAAQARLNAAIEKSRKAAEELEAGRTGEREATEAAEELRKASEELAKAARKDADKAEAEARAAAREATAKRAEELAKELGNLAENKETKHAGMSGTVREAEEAARRAAEEMRRAADAARQGEAQRARESARAAAERMERAADEMREGLREGEDLLERQGNVAEDLKNLADGAKPEQTKSDLKAAGQTAQQAREQLKKSDYKGASKTQEDLLQRMEKLTQEAEERVKQAAARQKDALDRAQKATQAAAKRARDIGEVLKAGARSARENDARRRLDQAGEHTEKAEEALRRSLRRLGEAMPKSAEQDRKESLEEIENAQRVLKGLRESHGQPNQSQRQRLKQLADKQKSLEDDVRKLEERMKRLKQEKGIEKIQDAQSAMREAGRRLRNGEPDEAERAQERAEKALKEMEKELDEEERRYRALRQYELLFKLKQELEGFRRTAQGHREWLSRIDEMVRRDGRVTRYVKRNEINKLRSQLKTLFRDVDEKAEAVGKEGAVVYTYILKGCGTDLKEVEAQLSLKEVGLVPQELMGDVVRRFDLAIKGLERDLRERQNQQQQQGQQRQQQGSQRPRLVPPDAEIRMVMVLQKSLNGERESFFDNRPDFGQRRPTPGEKARLERMYHQQGSLAELFDNLRESIRRHGESDEPDFPPDEGEEQEKPR